MFGVKRKLALGLLIVGLAAAPAPILAQTTEPGVTAVDSSTPAAPVVTLAAALADLQAEARNLAVPPAGATWGQHQALDDLQRLVNVTQDLQTALADPQVTPAQLHPLRDGLVIARQRLQASLPLLGVPAGALLEHVDRVGLCLKTLEYRFDGRAQIVGPALAQANVVESARLPHYENPRELLLEARNVYYLAQAFTRLRGAWRGAASPGWGWGTEFYDFVSAAYDYEWVCNGSYANVHDTRPAYNKLVRTYNKARSFGYGLDRFRWTDLEKAFTRLEQFYAAAP